MYPGKNLFLFENKELVLFLTSSLPHQTPPFAVRHADYRGPNTNRRTPTRLNHLLSYGLIVTVSPRKDRWGVFLFFHRHSCTQKEYITRKVTTTLDPPHQSPVEPCGLRCVSVTVVVGGRHVDVVAQGPLFPSLRRSAPRGA